LAIALDRPYDVIFVDVQESGLEHIEVTARIRETRANGSSPVVFLTDASNFNAWFSAGSGSIGDFLGKPFLPAEITLKALTSVWRGRLDKLGQVHGDASPVPKIEAEGWSQALAK
jgi:CheY-like chemotaxis protein